MNINVEGTESESSSVPVESLDNQVQPEKRVLGPNDVLNGRTKLSFNHSKNFCGTNPGLLHRSFCCWNRFAHRCLLSLFYYSVKWWLLTQLGIGAFGNL